MTLLADKYNSTVDESVADLMSRASESRSLDAAAVRPRIVAAINKYLLIGDNTVEKNDIRSFIDEIRADDLCLIIACEQGDAKAWENLVANFDATVKSAARKITSNNEDAEDLASSIWAELYGLRQDAEGNRKSKLAYYSGRGSLAGWLRAVVSQLAVDQFRKQSKFVQIEENREFENLVSEAARNDNNHFPTRDDNPEDLFTDKQTEADVSRALSASIASLESEGRLIVKLYYFEGLKLKDIAAAFGYHEATASRRLTRVQNEIRKGVESELCNKYGWTESDVKRHLSETAEGLGLNLETLFAVLLILAFMQEMAA